MSASPAAARHAPRNASGDAQPPASAMAAKRPAGGAAPAAPAPGATKATPQSKPMTQAPVPAGATREPNTFGARPYSDNNGGMAGAGGAPPGSRMMPGKGTAGPQPQPPMQPSMQQPQGPMFMQEPQGPMSMQQPQGPMSMQQPQRQMPMGGNPMMMGGYGGGMYGAGGYGSMADMGNGAAPNTAGDGSMYGGMDGGYGSMAGPGAGSMYGGMNGADPMGSMYGGMGGMPMGSMYGMGGPMGSMYGMGGPMGSMYGMGGMPMDSMYGMGGMGSMYGMGGMGSMYGMGGMGSMMGPMGGSMYGMGGPMGGSMYGMGGPMGSMIARSMGFSSYGGNSIYGSMGGGSLMSMGSTRSVGGMWGTEEGYQVRRRRDRDIPTMARMLQDDDTETRKRNFVTETDKLKDKSRSGDTATGNGAAAGDAAKNGAAAEKGRDDKAKAGAEKTGAAAVAAAGEKSKPEDRSRGAAAADAAGKSGEAGKASAEAESAAAAANKDKGAVADRNGIHGLVIVEAAKSATIAAEKSETGQKVTLKHASGKPVVCKVDEVIEGADSDLSKSAVLNVVSTHLCSGHNVALIAVDKKEKLSPAVERAVVAFFADSLGKLATDQEWRATFSASALPGANKFRDLQEDAAGAAAAPAKDIAFGSNPIFGSCVMDLKTTMLRDVEAVAKHVKAVLAKKTQPQEIVLLQAIVRIRKGKDLFVCSMNAYIVRDIETAEAMMVLDDRRVPVPVLRTAIGGATRTAAVIALSGAPAAAAEEAETMRLMGTLCTKENLPPRSGNVPRFIEYTNEQVAKIEKDIASLSGSERDRRVHMVDKMRTMANDATDIVANFDAEPKVYPIHTRGTTGGAAPSSPAGVKKAAGAKEEAAAAPAAAPATSPRTAAAAAAAAPAAAAAAGAPAAAANGAKSREVGPASTPAAKNGAAAAATGADAKAQTPPKTSAAAADAAGAAPSANPFSSVHRLAYLQDAKAASVGKAVQLVVGSETKSYDVDECIDCPAGATANTVAESKELSRMTSVLGAGFNVALLGAEYSAATQPESQMTWKYVEHMLTTVLKTAAPELATQMTLHMAVVHEREVLADLIADKSAAPAPHRLVVATSPLFGPIVHESASTKASTPEEVHAAMSKALANAKPVLKEGAMIVMTAVVRQIRKDDVSVASVFAVSAADMRPYKGILEHNPAYSRTLFTYALGGPASTGVLITASRGMDAAELANALSAQRSVSHVKMPAPRNGSVKEFVQYAAGSLERQKKKVAAATAPAEKQAAENSLRRLADSLRDHEQLLAKPATTEPMAYPPDAASAAAASPATKEAPAPAAATAEAAKAKSPKAAVQRGSPAARREEDGAAVPGPQARAMRATPQATPRTAKAANGEEKPAQAAEPAAAAEEKAQPAAQAPAEASGAGATAAAPAKSPQQEKGQPVQFLAVITEELRSGLQAKEGWSAEGNGDQLVVTDVEGPHSFAVDEVVLRPNRSSPIDSKLLEELRRRFLGGDNAALLTADIRGSSASLEMVDRTVRRVLSKTPATHSLFLSLCALNESDNTVQDTLTEGAEFKPLEVNTSPLYGPSVASASFVKIDAVDQFSKLMGAGLRKCGESRSCVVLQLVQVEVKEEAKDADVCSLLAIMCPGDISIYRRALEQPVKERGLLSMALGGSCFTVFAAGVTKQLVDEGCMMLGRLAHSFKTHVQNLKPRGGSVKRFVEHTRGAVAQMQKNYERAATDEEKAKMQSYIEAVTVMVQKSEEYLADPVGKMPPSFPHGRREL